MLVEDSKDLIGPSSGFRQLGISCPGHGLGITPGL